LWMLFKKSTIFDLISQGLYLNSITAAGRKTKASIKCRKYSESGKDTKIFDWVHLILPQGVQCRKLICAGKLAESVGVEQSHYPG
jgi:hypothetical protein